MPEACNSSGVLSTSTVVSKSRVRITSLHVTSTDNALFTLKVFDSDSSSTSGKKEVAKIVVHAGGTAETMEQYMGGVICNNGIYAELTGTGTASINYA